MAKRKIAVVVSVVALLSAILTTQFITAGQEERVNAIPNKLGVFKTLKPAFLNLENLKQDEKTALTVTSFGMNGEDGVSIANNIGDKLTDFSVNPFEQLTTKITWPNGAKAVPYEYFNKKLLLVAGGFLVPGKGTGAITFIEMDTKNTFEISTPKSGWFYHRAEWLDVNKDNKPDLVVARANKPMIGSASGELVWFENSGDYKTKWKEHFMVKGPDCNLVIRDFDKDGTQEILALQYFSKKLALIWPNGDTYNYKVIDDKCGAAFDAQVVDLNKDGKEELLFTNHESSNGSVYVYDFPADIKKETWKRRTILTGIKTLQSGMGQASPGSPIAFVPFDGYQGKPLIVVAGDGSQKAHLLEPLSQEANNWEYKENILIDTKCTVGQIAVGDVNGDTFKEIFVPAYDNNEIHVFSYKD